MTQQLSSHAKRRWRMIFLISGSIIVLLIAASMYARYAPTDMDRDVAAIKAMGYPTTEAEIEKLEPSDGENADHEYQKFIADSAKVRNDTEFTSVLYSSAKHPVSKATREVWATKYRYLLPHLLAGSSAPRWTPEAKPGEESPVWITCEREVTGDGLRYLMQIAIADVEAGRVQQAMEEIKAGQGMIRQVSQRAAPTVVQINTIDNVWVRAVAQIAAKDPRPETLRQILTLLKSEPVPPNIEQNLRAYFVEQLQEIRVALAPERGEDLWSAMQQRYWGRADTQRTVALKVRMYREAFQLLPPKSVDANKIIEAFTQVQGRHASDPRVVKFDLDLGSFWKLTADRWLSLVARRRVLLVGIRIMLARAESGGYPAKLDPALGQDAIDPFTDSPLIYKTSSGGFVLYSIGDNRKDDGGRDSTGGNPGDIAFRI